MFDKCCSTRILLGFVIIPPKSAVTWSHASFATRYSELDPFSSDEPTSNRPSGDIRYNLIPASDVHPCMTSYSQYSTKLSRRLFSGKHHGCKFSLKYLWSSTTVTPDIPKSVYAVSIAGYSTAHYDSLIHTMKAQIYNIFFSTIALLTTHALTLPTLSLNSSDLNSTFTAIKTGVNCYPPTIRGSRLAATRDRLQAALLLPDGSDAGYFHNGNPDNDFRLPVIKTYDSCVAIVSLTQASPDRSSWDHISYVASQMAAICSVGQYPVGQTGGVTSAGYQNHIRVSLERASKGVGDVS